MGRVAFENRIVKVLLLDAGCGGGWDRPAFPARGADAAIGCELEWASAQHASARYGETTSLIQANLDALPMATASVDLLVSIQVIEAPVELASVSCRVPQGPDGRWVRSLSTPNRLTFSPGSGRGERPTNPFHVEEFDPETARRDHRWQPISECWSVSVLCMASA